MFARRMRSERYEGRRMIFNGRCRCFGALYSLLNVALKSRREKKVGPSILMTKSRPAATYFNIPLFVLKEESSRNKMFLIFTQIHGTNVPIEGAN
jgi:hypothetical protein